jgi:hypothetical protein
MSANLQYMDSMSPQLESKLRSLYNQTAEMESAPKTVNEYVGPVFGGMSQQQSTGWGGMLVGGGDEDMYGGAGRVRRPRVRPGRGNGSAKQKAAASSNPWLKHLQELKATHGWSHRKAIMEASCGKTGYVAKRPSKSCAAR